MSDTVYLYAILVAHRLWNTPKVCEGNHYKIHAIPKEQGKSEEEAVMDYCWDLQVTRAHSYGSPEVSECLTCNETELNCSCDCPVYSEEDFEDFVERNATYRVTKYDPDDIEHLLCPGAERYRDTEARNAILRLKAIKNKASEINTLNRKINELEDELCALKKQRTALETEFNNI